MKQILLTIASLLIALSATAGSPSFTIHLIGDSTCAPKEYEKGDLERGWGMYFPNFFTEDVNVINYARNGRSTKSFIDEGRWEEVKQNNTHSVARGAHKTAGIICDSIRVKVPSLAGHLLDRPFDLAVAKDGSGDFMTVQEAVDAVTEQQHKGRFTILIKE